MCKDKQSGPAEDKTKPSQSEQGRRPSCTQANKKEAVPSQATRRRGDNSTKFPACHTYWTHEVLVAHSGKLRARQTAEAVMKALLAIGFEACPTLAVWVAVITLVSARNAWLGGIMSRTGWAESE